MSTARTVVTPPQRKREHVPNSKSSESLPSPSVWLGKADNRLKTGSRSVALPHNAAVGFQTTSTLLKYNLLSLQKGSEEEVSPVKKKAGKVVKADSAPKEKKQRAKQGVTGVDGANMKTRKAPAKEVTEKPKRTRKRKSDETELQASEVTSVSNDGQLARSGKNLVDDQSTIGTSEIPKPAEKGRKRRKTLGIAEADDTEDSACRGKVTKPTRKTSKCSTHFATNGEERKGKQAEKEHAGSAEVEPAVKRKPNWTPPKPGVTTSNVDVYSIPSSSPGATLHVHEAPAVNFAALQKDFGYQLEASPATSATREGIPVTATSPRKRIGLLPDLNSKPLLFIQEQPGPVIAMPTKDQLEQTTATELPRPIAKESRKASPKKGPGGITARSIARYAVADSHAADFAARTSPHFAPGFSKPAIAAEQVPKELGSATKKVTKPRKPRTKKAEGEKDAKKKGPAKAKVVAFIAPKLVSPKQHEAKLKRQDLLFGTSSQLRQDLSPNLVRTLQDSLNDAVDEHENEERRSSPILMRYAGAVRRTKGNLWAESTHEDLDTSWQRLSDVEEANDEAKSARTDANIPLVDDLPSSFDVFSSAADEQGQDSAPVASNGFWLSKAASASAPALPFAQTIQPLATTIVISSSSPRQAVSPPRVALRPLSTNTKSPTKQKDPSKSQAVDTINSRDDANAPEENETRRPRGRPRKDTLPTSPTKPHVRPRKLSALSPGQLTPKKRGRPRKKTTMQLDPDDHVNAGFQHIDDIEDSESDHTPTPKKRGSPSASQPLPLTTAVETETVGKRVNTAILNSSHPRWPEVKAKLFQEITSTVKSAPPTNSIKDPTWHEKMLLYDPIVLEDITSWLNDQGLRVESKDGALVEISCWMTQAWCEANSICCLWKEGLRGGVRTRY